MVKTFPLVMPQLEMNFSDSSIRVSSHFFSADASEFKHSWQNLGLSL